MNSLVEECQDDAPKRKSPTNWTPFVAIVLAIISMAVSGLVSYGHDQSDLRVKTAVSAAVGLTDSALQPLRDKESTLSDAVATLKAQRVEDSNRLIRIEDKVDRLLSINPPLRTRPNIPQVQAARP